MLFILFAAAIALAVLPPFILYLSTLFRNLYIIQSHKKRDYPLSKEVLYKFRPGESCGICIILGTSAAIAIGLFLICTTLDHQQRNIITQKIEMYEEENAIIEKEINVIIEGYKTHESNLFQNIGITSLVIMYPEIKADALVSKQIEIYMDNYVRIRVLKNRLISLQYTDWWLFLK